MKTPETLGIFPLPKEVTFGEGVFRVPDSVRLTDGPDRRYIEVFLERTGLKEGGEDWLRFSEDASLGPGEYVLEVTPSRVRLSRSSDNGAVNGLTSLWMLLEEGKEIPCCRIQDGPRYSHRGLSLDCVRHFFPSEEVKRIIEQISRVKMDRLRWRLSDDQGWRIQCDSFPELNRICPRYYTKEEVREVVEYAAVRGVEIIPEIDVPGHVTAILAAYPELSCSGGGTELPTGAGVFLRILCAGNEAVYDFLDQVFAEVCPLFPYEYFHVGGDEAPKREWEACPKCRKAMEENGLKDTEQLQGLFTRRVAELLKKYGKKPFCWNEQLRSGLLPEDAVVQFWNLTDARLMNKYVRDGGTFVYSDMFRLYFDYPYSMLPLRRTYTFRPKIGSASCDEAPGMLGMEACLWTEHISERERLESMLFPRTFAVAARAWGEDGKDYASFLRRLEKPVRLAERDGIKVRGREGWDPRGKDRKEETFSYMRTLQSGLKSGDGEGAGGQETPVRFLLAFVRWFLKPADLLSLRRLLAPDGVK